jgi:hypothetical protein
LIISRKIGGWQGNLHNLTVPKSWLVRFLTPDESLLKQRECYDLDLLIGPIGELLAQIYFGAGKNCSTDADYDSSIYIAHLLYGIDRSPEMQDALIRSVFMSRVYV